MFHKTVTETEVSSKNLNKCNCNRKRNSKLEKLELKQKLKTISVPNTKPGMPVGYQQPLPRQQDAPAGYEVFDMMEKITGSICCLLLILYGEIVSINRELSVRPLSLRL